MWKLEIQRDGALAVQSGLFVCFLKIDGLDTEFLKSLSVTSNETSNMSWVKRKRGIYWLGKWKLKSPSRLPSIVAGSRGQAIPLGPRFSAPLSSMSFSAAFISERPALLVARRLPAALHLTPILGPQEKKFPPRGI